MLQAGVYGFLHWTPAVFWELSIPEYYAAMEGIQTLENAKEESRASNKTGARSLSKQDVNELRDLLERQKQND